MISLRDISQEAERCWGCARNKEHRAAEHGEEEGDQRQLVAREAIDGKDGGHRYNEGDEAEKEHGGAAEVGEAIPPEEEPDAADQRDEGEGGRDDDKRKAAKQELTGEVHRLVTE